MVAPVLDTTRMVRPALLTIAQYLSVIMISLMAMVKPAHADGQVDSINVYTINSGGSTNGCIAKASAAEAMQCDVDFVNRHLDAEYAQISSWGGYDIAICPRAVAHDLNTSNPNLYFFKVSPIYELFAYMPPNPKIAVCTGGGETSSSIIVTPSSCPSSTYAGFPCTCKDDYQPDPFHVSCVPVPVAACTVDQLKPLDPAMKPYEDGLIDLTNVTNATRAGAACIVREARARHLYPQIESGYRPPEYQTHIREVFDKWQLLRDNNDSVCADTKIQVELEYMHHSPFSHQPGETSHHSSRLAVDIHLSDYTDADTIATVCNMSRPVANDRSHFESQR